MLGKVESTVKQDLIQNQIMDFSIVISSVIQFFFFFLIFAIWLMLSKILFSTFYS